MLDLSDFESILRIERLGPPVVDPGEFVTFKVTPSLSGLRITQLIPSSVLLNGLIEPSDGAATQAITGTITLLPQAPAQINLQGLAGTIPQTLGGELKFPPEIPGQIDLSSQLPNEPALHSLTGTIELPQDMPVKAEVAWQVLAEVGLKRPVFGEVNTKKKKIVISEEEREEHFLAPEGLSGPSLSILFVNPIVELRQDKPLPEPRRYWIRCTVTLRALGVTKTFDLPDVPVFVPVIGVPTVLALFPETNFLPKRGALLVVVPERSPFREVDELLSLVNRLQGIVSRLTAIPRFALFALGLQRLAAAIHAPRLRFKVRDEIANLNKVKLADIDASYVRYNGADVFDVGDQGNDMEAEDNMSSLMLLGPPGRQVRCYNRRDLQAEVVELEIELENGARIKVSDGGQVNVATGNDMFVALPDLRQPERPLPAPMDAPGFQGDPGGIIAVDSFDPGKGFSDTLSSIAFDWAPRVATGPLYPPVVPPGRTPPVIPRSHR